MAKCPYCGTENQTGAVFCTSCGSNLGVQQSSPAQSTRVGNGSGNGMTFNLSQRYERALRKVERLGLIIIVLSVVTVLLVLV
jgi:uncharacterized membrane protein YvbJ